MIKSYAITGPTASGKTSLSLPVAEALGCEIICCDSMQIYKYMDIGTAKPTVSERTRVAHHLTDFVMPTDSYSAQEYRRDALRVAGELSEYGKSPLFVGGTGLYLDSLTRCELQAPESTREYRDKILSQIKTEEDKDALWQRLYEVDPVSAAATHKNNVRRIIRALEIYEVTGKPKSYFDDLSRQGAEDISVKHLTLDFYNRENLYSRVDTRVDIMMEDGLYSEVKSLCEKGLLPDGATASQAIGYKEILAHIRGELSLSEAIELIKLSSRRYAKRQLTWFRHNKDAYRLYVDTPDGKMRKAEELLDEALCFFKNS